MRTMLLRCRLVSAGLLQLRRRRICTADGPLLTGAGPSSKNKSGDGATAPKPGDKLLTVDTMNANMVRMEYAVRGPLVIRAAGIEQELADGATKPFASTIRANIGDAHAMGQQPIAFVRNVQALCCDPGLLCDADRYPADCRERAQTILDGCAGGSIGAYSDSLGLEVVRRHVAEFIERRDGGIESRWQDVYLCAGASTSIKSVMGMFVQQRAAGKAAGVMVPIPVYPLYSALIAEFGLAQVSYHLNESNQWGLDIDELQAARKRVCGKAQAKVLVVINPGNPTGQVLSRPNIEAIIRFAYDKRLFIFADEVYQDNVYDPALEFVSFKRVLKEMGAPYADMEMASFMSCSKGYMGECGIRGGYCELINVDDAVRAQYQKALSAQLCPTTLGQACTDCVVHPPRAGEPSHAEWAAQRQEVLCALAERAAFVSVRLNEMEGITCNRVQGAMYAFPRLHLPERAEREAKAAGQPADVFYAFALLEATGICVVPGSGFGQLPGTWHFRTTILPQMERLCEMMEKMEAFNAEFMKKYK